jgi:hypothetical protein
MRRFHRRAEILDGIDLFVGCSRRQLASLADHAGRLVLRSGTTIARPGQPARQLVVVRRGTVEINGRAVWVDPHGPALAIEVQPVIDHGRFDATVRTLTEVDAVVIDGPAVRRTAPELGRRHERLRPEPSPPGSLAPQAA